MTADSCPVMVITGVSRGLGKLLAKHYSASGYRVIGLSRSPSNLTSSNIECYEVDLCEESALKKIFADIATKYSSVSVLINNAGVSSAKFFSFADRNELASALDGNVLSASLATRECLRLMSRQRFGRVVNISSVHVSHALVGASMYSASKAALETLGKSMAAELYPLGITVNNLRLSVVCSVGMSLALSEKAAGELISRTIVKDYISLEDVTYGIDFLIGPGARKITGQTISVGG